MQDKRCYELGCSRDEFPGIIELLFASSRIEFERCDLSVAGVYMLCVCDLPKPTGFLFSIGNRDVLDSSLSIDSDESP